MGRVRLSGGGETRYTLCGLFASIQGEGRWLGRPMVFVRFWGCPWSCSWCDEPSHRDPEAAFEMTGTAVLARIREVGGGIPFVVLTGGEPLAAAGLSELMVRLRREGYWVAVETSGAGGPWPVEADWVTLSPKSLLPESWWRRADEIKLVVGPELASMEAAWLEMWRGVAAMEGCPELWVQPRSIGGRVDERAVAHCLALVMAGAGRLRYSPQLHKYLGIP